MKKTPLVSILIPLYNAEAYVAETLESCLAQTYPTIEMIVVDDGSLDNGLKIARQYEEAHENIRVYTQKNGGAPKARNFALTKAKGEYIQYLDADDLMSENKIALQMALAASLGYDPSVILTSKFSYFKDSIADAQYFSQPIDHSYESGVKWLIDAWSGGGFGVVMGWLTHRSLIESAGVWDESLRKNQDGEFFSRVLIGAKKVIMCDDVMVYYRRTGADSISAQFKESAAASTLGSLGMYEKNIEGIDNEKLRKALAYTFLGFIANYYPHFPSLLEKAEEEIKRLGFNYHTLPTAGKFAPLAKIIGSKNVIRLRYWLRKPGVNQ